MDTKNDPFVAITTAVLGEDTMDSMDTIQEIGIAYWKVVEDFYKSITPRVNGRVLRLL